MKYERKRLTVDAQQWAGNLEDITVVPLRQIEGAMGYNAKLAYYDDPNGRTHNVRPGDYVVKYADEAVKIMDKNTFLSEFVEKNAKSANNRPKVGDNDFK